MKAYTYVIVHDSGSAPNYDAPCATLAICKPQIRLHANIGDLVVGFSGANLGPERHGVRWAGVVSEKVSLSEYWSDQRFSGKKPNASRTPDNIYRPAGQSLVQVKNGVHDEGNSETDIEGRYVLVFGECWRFGAVAPIMPDEFGLRMIGGRRGHRVVSLTDSQWSRLRRWLNTQRTGIVVDARPGSCNRPAARPAFGGSCRSTRVRRSQSGS